MRSDEIMESEFNCLGQLDFMWLMLLGLDWRQSSMLESQASSQLAVKTSKLDELFLLCWFFWLLATGLFGFCLVGVNVIDDTETSLWFWWLSLLVTAERLALICLENCFIMTLPGSLGFGLELLPELADHCFQNVVFVALILLAEENTLLTSLQYFDVNGY